MTVNNPRHYCNDACRRAQRASRPPVPAPVSDRMSPATFVLLVIVSAVCIGSWGAILFYGLPWIVGGVR